MHNRHFVANPLEWPRWSAYESADDPFDGWTYAAGDAATPLVITADLDLASPLAKVARPPRLKSQVEALERFYDDYGLLGQQVDGSLGLTPEQRMRKARFNGRREIRPGDSVAWALAHAENVRRILRAISSREWPRLRRELGLRTGGQHPPETLRPAARQTLALLARGVTRHVPTTAAPWQQPLDLETPDRGSLLAHLLNPNLTIRCELDPGTREPRFRFRALIEAIYWQLWYRAAGKADIRRCENPRCGAPFFAREPRQRFCPAPPGKESRCARVARARRQDG
jgi:hypothetical protein